NSITNLTLSCEKCNTKKGTKDIKDFLKKDPSKLEKILKQAKRPLADAAAVNTTRLALLEVFKATELPVETGSGGLTKFNRNWIGAYIGRVAVRTSGSFNISTVFGLIQGISYKYCKSIHKKDGYEYGKSKIC
ncbi:MAG: HNH endonuclease, partial [Anabaena sp. CRKS33]